MENIITQYAENDPSELFVKFLNLYRRIRPLIERQSDPRYFNHVGYQIGRALVDLEEHLKNDDTVEMRQLIFLYNGLKKLYMANHPWKDVLAFESIEQMVFGKPE